MDSVKAKVVSAAIPGVSRLLSTKKVIFKVVWASVVATMWSFFLVTLSNIAQRYSLYPVNLNIQYRGVPFEFPDLYVCNPCPASKSKIVKGRAYFLSQAYFNLFEKVNNFTTSNFDEIDWIYYYPLVYATAETDVLNRFMHSKEQTIVKAFISNDLESEEITDAFETFSHDTYHRCFKFKNSSLLNTPDKMLTLYLFYDFSEFSLGALEHQDSIQTWMTSTFRGNIESDIPSGLVLLFSNKDTYPGENAYRMTVGTGMSTDIVVSMNSLSLIDAPNKPCTMSKSKVTTFSHWENETTDYIMDSAMCLAYNISMEYHRRCGCVPYNVLVPWEIRTETRTCYNISELSADSVKKDLDCIEKIGEKSLHPHLAKKCQDLCQRNEYFVQSSYSSWPPPVLTEHVLKKLKLDASLRKSTILNEAPGWIQFLLYNIHNESHLLHSTMKQSLVKVTFRAATAESVSMEEQRAFPLSSLLSAIGGTFSLYLGLNIMKTAEVVDSLLGIVLTIWRKKSKIEAPDHPKQRNNAWA